MAVADIDRNAPFPVRPGPWRDERVPVAIVGAGPVGLALAVDLAQRGVRATVIDGRDRPSSGSRAICWAQRTLEIFDRLGVDEAAEWGVTWRVGRLFHRDAEVYSFDLQPEPGHRMPAFVNLQQFAVEHLLIRRCEALGVDLRFGHRVVAHREEGDAVALSVEAPDADYVLRADWLVACDGARSPVRERMGLALEGQRFEERFLIADVAMKDDPFEGRPPERWFWFEPPFHAGQSALLHKQPGGIYRIDLQLGPGADLEAERDPARVTPRIRRMVGDKPFELDWLSVYRFTCARLDRFVHGRTIFAGDSAHVVSPFGARGGNGGVQDADNLGWKLVAILRGRAHRDLLATYDEERGLAADENIAHSARATAFMTPKNAAERAFRDAVLDLAHEHPFARALINSGRLSRPASLAGTSLHGADDGAGPLRAGEPCPDAPLDAPLWDDGSMGGGSMGGESMGGWMLARISAAVADGSMLALSVGDGARGRVPEGVPHAHVALPGETARTGDWLAADGTVERRWGRDRAFLIRPDAHVLATGGAASLKGAFDGIRRVPLADAAE